MPKEQRKKEKGIKNTEKGIKLYISPLEKSNMCCWSHKRKREN